MPHDIQTKFMKNETEVQTILRSLLISLNGLILVYLAERSYEVHS
jgi:hypothetical protein